MMLSLLRNINSQTLLNLKSSYVAPQNYRFFRTSLPLQAGKQLPNQQTMTKYYRKAKVCAHQRTR